MLKCAGANSTVRATDEQESIRYEAMESDVERYNPVFVLGNLVYRSGGILLYVLQLG